MYQPFVRTIDKTIEGETILRRRTTLTRAGAANCDASHRLLKLKCEVHAEFYTGVTKMVPQQQDSPSNTGIPMFGSLLVDKNSSTPYSDATQVIIHHLFFSTRYLVRTRAIDEETSFPRSLRGQT